MEVTKHIHFEKIDSTNTWAKQHSDQWDLKGMTLVTAAEQSGGRGRFNRKWVSPANLNIYATFCFWYSLERNDVGHIPQMLAIAASKSLENQGFFPQLKWPNDILLSGKKVGGILCETIVEGTKRGVICGIGLNVNMPLDILQLIDRPATSLCVEGGRSFEVSNVLETLKQCFVENMDLFLKGGFDQFFSYFQEKSSFKKGDEVRFHDNQIIVEANFVSLHPDGSVELRLRNGMLKKYYAGEFIA